MTAAMWGGGLPMLALSAGTLEAAAACAAAGALIWLPWEKAPVWLSRVFSGVSALLLLWAAARTTGLYTAGVPTVQIAAGAAAIVWLYSRFGERALCRAMVTAGGATTAVLAFITALCLLRGTVGSPSSGLRPLPLLAETTALFGGAVSMARREKTTAARRAAKIGASAGAALWILVCAAAMGICKGVLPYTVFAAWRRVTLFDIFYCPDVLAAALLIVCALQTAGVFLSDICLYKRK